MSPEETPPPTTNGTAPPPVKLSFGVGKGLGLGKKKTPLVNKTAASAFGHNEEKVDTHEDELIAGLDGNKIESLVPKEEAQPLVIPKLENADWREQILAKRKKTYMPEESLRAPIEVIEEPIKEVGFGLQIKKRIKVEHRTEDKQDATNVDTAANTSAATMEVTEDVVMEERTETLDEIAARKIIEATSGERPEDARRLVVHGQENIDDVEAFQKNLEELPDEATLEDYEKVPVEEFGAALLRGMGWSGDMEGSEA
ncbi:DExH-box splicing factor binding site-domain-containing protein [Dissophora ornata]|nr:DExH-box splicing factor binding site-domain-containing protein [Dissophora ornata]